MARKRKASDDVYNARRRYARQAERYLKRAEASSGIASSRYSELAAQAVRNAVNTYADIKQDKFSKIIDSVARKLDIGMLKPSARADRNRIVESSKKALAKFGTVQERKELEGKSLMGGFVGHRIFGATVELWQDKASYIGDDGMKHIDTGKALQIIMDFFGVDNELDLIDAFESRIGGLYDKPDQDIAYDTVIVMAQSLFRV